ncbi:hypothetical protein [Novosphingobium sp.]|uniref:hypothetical protein n=1 Tax=Novosphingobium sp. TaxID=1874826 RepID=UPI003D0CAAD0
MAERLQIQAAVAKLLASGTFDPQWYLDRYPDARQSMLSPAEHFLRIGQILQRQPNAGASQNGAIDVQRIPFEAKLKPFHRELESESRQAILASGLFDEAYYYDRAGEALSPGADALQNYCERESDWDVPSPSALFSSSWYLAQNPDIGSMSPLAHAALHGLTEGRQVFDPGMVNQFLEHNATKPSVRWTDVINPNKPAIIYHWSDGNFFFAEIAAYLEVLLCELGVNARLAVENEKPSIDVTAIVIAPHEFCVLGGGRFWSDELLARAVYCNTEQWHTGWFTHALHFVRKSGIGLDINPTSASGLNALGYTVAFLPLIEIAGSPFSSTRAPLSPEFRAARAIDRLTYPESYRDRPYDILFVGANNDRRSALLSQLAPVLSEWNTFLHCPHFKGPVVNGDPDMMRTEDAVQIAQNSRILLNIHQGKSQYFEWHRLYLLGIARGCVVMSEPCLSNSWIREGTHYLACEVDQMGEKINWLLGTSQGERECERITGNCAKLVERLADVKAALA